MAHNRQGAPHPPTHEATTHRRNPGVQAFLDDLARALTAGDTRRVGALWQPPVLVIGDDDERLVQSRRDVEQFFAGAKAQYNARGITDTRADIQELHWLTDRIAIAEVRWPYLDAQGREVGEETSTYVLKRDGHGDLKLRVALMHGMARPH